MVAFHFTPMSRAGAEAILRWRYDPPYNTYNALEDDSAGFDAVAEMLDARSPHFAMCVTGARGWESEDPAGFFAFGSSCEVGSEPDAPHEPHLRRADGSITIGLGLRPDLTGRGLDAPFVEAGLALARERYHPTAFRLFVYAWNQRAITVYERAGFRYVGRAGASGADGRPAFIETWRNE